jgi:hypothetical protein
VFPSQLPSNADAVKSKDGENDGDGLNIGEGEKDPDVKMEEKLPKAVEKES